MAELLSILHDEVASKYRTVLDLELRGPTSDTANVDSPQWLPPQVNRETDDKASSLADHAATLLDPDIGVVHYFIPYAVGDDIRPDIIRALNQRSQLRRERGLEDSASAAVDKDGSWRIVLVWLVPDAAREGWISGIVSLRAETGFSEELSFDAIFYNPSDPGRSFKEHRYPRLLMSLRKVVGLRKLNDALVWSSADSEVRRALSGFSQQFNVPEQKGLAREVERLVDERSETRTEAASFDSPWAQGDEFQAIHIRNFRSVKEFGLDLGHHSVKSAVVWGPNGTGKSSVAEAISIARFGSSRPYQRFCTDVDAGDNGRRPSAGSYLSDYLRRLGSNGAQPTFGIVGTDQRPFQTIDPTDADGVGGLSEANVLAQETASEFVRLTGEQAALRVLRGYSALADLIEARVEAWVRASNERRQTYLRSLGVAVTITKLETVEQRIAERVLRDRAPSFSSTLQDWLSSVANLPGAPLGRLVDLVDKFGSPQSMSNLAQEIVREKDRRDIRPFIREWLEDYQQLTKKCAEQLAEVDKQLSSDGTDLDEVIHLASVWGEFLSRPAPSLVPKEGAGGATSPEQVTSLRTRFDQVRRRGRETRERAGHLEASLRLIDTIWGESHPNECPTCAADHSATGGIRPRISSLFEATKKEIEDLTDEVETLRSQLEGAQLIAAKEGVAENPVAAEQRAQVMATLQWLTPAQSSFEEVLRNPGSRAALIATARAIRSIPVAPDLLPDPDSTAAELEDLLRKDWVEAQEVFEEPTNWAVVHKKLTTTMTEVVDRHLPETVERVWLETILALTSASWVNWRTPRLKASSRRNVKRVRIEAESRLARYILNQSESHVLGLSWFVVDYLLRGRFEMPLMVMDDPSQEMDETTFREFCRFMESFVRLHRRSGKPLALIVFLHQESRSLDLARAVVARYFTLRWRDSQELDVQELAVVDQTLYPKSPSAVLGSS